MQVFVLIVFRHDGGFFNTVLFCLFITSGALRHVLTASLAQCVLKEGDRIARPVDTVMEKVLE